MSAYNYERFFKITHDLLCITGMDGYFRQVNPSFNRVLGWSNSEVIDQPFINFVHPEDIESTLKVFDKLETSYSTLAFDTRFRSKQGTYCNLQWRAYPDNKTELLYAVGHDVTEITALQTKLSDMESIDALTGLQNRQSFSRHLYSDIQLMHRVGKPLSLLLVDVDYYKQLTEMHGFREGENILKIIARHLRGIMRSTDLVARFDGEAFAIILPNTTREHAIKLGEKCRKAVHSCTWKKHTITVSIGASTLTVAENDKKYSTMYPNDYSRVLFNEAKHALHSSRGRGRNRVTHFDDLK
jgi:diguanylate cyclase (GGDEF)-like protein/PAS domain S-box-containing protein